MIETCPICQRNFCTWCGMSLPVTYGGQHVNPGDRPVVPYRHCKRHNGTTDLIARADNDHRPSGLVAALETLRAELRKLGVKPDSAGYYTLGVAYRGTDAIAAAVKPNFYATPLEGDHKWLPNQRGELMGFRLVEEAP